MGEGNAPGKLAPCILRQPASEAPKLLEKRRSFALLEQRLLKSAVSEKRHIRRKISLEASFQLQEMSKFCSSVQQKGQW